MAYAPLLMERFQQPRHRGALAGATHAARVRNPLCGDEVTMALRVVDGRIEDARFDGVGCVISLGAADIVVAGLIGKPVEAVDTWDLARVEGEIGDVVAGRQKCASLATEAAKKAATTRVA